VTRGVGQASAHVQEPAAPRRASAEQATLLLELISSGALDDHLALLTRVIGQRQRHLLDAASVRALAALDVGDRVRVNRHVRPLYLQGSTGTVMGWSGRSVIVSLDEQSGRFAEVRCHPIGLDRLGG
jgi:ribosomal protein L21E